MAFAVATCPKCAEQFRLVWRIGKKKLAPSAVIRLTCPACAHSFEQVAVELIIYGAGKEQFPRSVVVEPSALVRASGVEGDQAGLSTKADL
jgi:hypothetical protein